MALYLILYSVERFIVEFYRGDPVRGFVAQNQLFGLAVFVVGLVLFLFFTWKRLRAGQVAALMFVVAAAVMGFMGIYSDTSDVEQITPFSTSQFLGFYVFATGLAMFLRARYFGDPRPPDYGRPPLDAAPATANQLG